MSDFKYYRPQSLDEALPLLKSGRPLGGGTALTPRISQVDEIVDLSELNLGGVRIEGDSTIIGSMVTLQDLLETPESIPTTLRNVCRQEAAWNIRNVATLGGTIMSADGRSPVLTVFQALEVQVNLVPDPETLSLGELLKRRIKPNWHRLITEFVFQSPDRLFYTQISRTPMDRPIVCAALAVRSGSGQDLSIQVSLGGFGPYPILLPKYNGDLPLEKTSVEVKSAAQEAFSQAEDDFASAAYRSNVAGVLAGRLLGEALK